MSRRRYEPATHLRPQVRQELDSSPTPTRTARLKVRDFEEWFSHEERSGALLLRGRVCDEGLIIDVTGAASTLVKGTCETDAEGAYAILGAGKYDLGHRRLLCVDVEAQDQDCDYASIAYRELYGDADDYEQEGASVRSYRVFFNPAGNVDGSACSTPCSRPPLPGGWGRASSN